MWITSHVTFEKFISKIINFDFVILYITRKNCTTKWLYHYEEIQSFMKLSDNGCCWGQAQISSFVSMYYTFNRDKNYSKQKLSDNIRPECTSKFSKYLFKTDGRYVVSHHDYIITRKLNRFSCSVSLKTYKSHKKVWVLQHE